MAGTDDQFFEHEDQPWTRAIPNHTGRQDSPEYRASRKAMTARVNSVPDFFYGTSPFEDHHGGGLWLKDQDGWFMIKNLAGMEWSSQFCADPKKVDQLRRNARRVYAAFPEAVAELRIRELLDRPITTAEDVVAWTDSICNASVPLSADLHRAYLPTAGGIHHYPTPVAEIAFFKFDDFQLWVTDEQNQPAAVAPVSPRGQGDWQVHVLYATPNSALYQRSRAAQAKGKAIVWGKEHPATLKAFEDQRSTEPHDQGESEPHRA